MTEYFKDVVGQRDCAFKLGDNVLFTKLRNKVNRLKKSLRRAYVDKKILKVTDR